MYMYNVYTDYKLFYIINFEPFSNLCKSHK